MKKFHLSPSCKHPNLNKNGLPDLLCFSHLEWNFVFQRPQHLMVRWAKERRVFYIEEPKLSSNGNHMSLNQCSTGVYYVTPYLCKGLSGQEAQKEIKSLLDEFMEDCQVSNYINWYYTPMALPSSQHLSPLAVIYDCMDELSNFKNADPQLRIKEKELLESADVVFTGGHSLYRLKSLLHDNIYPFPSSVDIAHFEQARTSRQLPSDQEEIPHPRIGFYGVIDERFDIQLIKDLAKRRPEWQFVLIGPVVKIDPATLPRYSNIHYLGQKSYLDLPVYLSGWDVAILPFAKNDSTRYISPTKTLEYLAGGKPVVSTSIEDVVSPYGRLNLVSIADTVQDFEKAVEDALKNPHARRVAADEYVKQLSWDKTWSQMKAHIQDILDKRNFSSLNSSRSSFKDAYDFVIVGAGFAGSVAAECLASEGNKVLICDRRPHIGGNAYDHYDSSGILVHKYGPHIFHTNSENVFNYLSRFTAWRPYEHRVLSCVDGKLLPIPINLDTINHLYGWNLTSSQLEEFFQRVAEPRTPIKTSEDVIISKVGHELYKTFFRNYTRKQWGLDPSQLDSTVIARIPVRTNKDDRYFTDKYQAMPAQGFTKLFESMLSHSNITQEMGIDYKTLIKKVSFKQLIYTGPIDMYFDYCYGKLPYRSLEFKFETHAKEVFQPAPVINYPNDFDYTRVTEFKYLTGQKHHKTSIVYEFSKDQGDPYYPIPRAENSKIYRKYQALADRTAGVHFVGRLGTYKYYNMDQVVAQAMTLAAKLTGTRRTELIANP